MKNQFETIQPWIPVVLAAIKRDIKTDHLPGSAVFARTHFGKRPLNRLPAEEIFAAYEKDLLAGDADLAEWVVNRWVFKHGDIYSHFAEKLQGISEDYASIKSLTEAQSKEILKSAPEKFGYLPVYLFSVLNGVVFPESVFTKLREGAEKEEAAQKTAAIAADEQQNYEQASERFRRDTARMQEKYDDKVAGVMKKYATDVEALKKQVRALQQQLNSR